MAVLSRALVAFDERRADPTVNLGTLGAAGNVAYTGTVRLAPTPVAYVRLPGVSGNFLSTPDAAAVDITGDLEIVCRVSLADWTPTANSTLVSKRGLAAGTSSYMLRVNTAGTLSLVYSVDGTTNVARTSTVATGITDGATAWVKVEFDVDNGASGHNVRFYTAADQATEPSSWTQLGTTVTTAGVTSIAATTAQVEVGTFGGGTSELLTGNVHRAVVRNGIGGSTVLDVDTSVLTDEGATSFTATTGQTVTINRSTGATYKTEVVVPGTGSRLFNGASDFGEVPDLAGLDFGAADSFTVFALVRQWATLVGSGPMVNKKSGTGAAAGFSLRNRLTPSTDLTSNIGDGTNAANNTNGSTTAGVLTLVAMIVNRSAQTMTNAANGTISTTASISAVGSLSSSDALWVGRFGATYNPMRVHAWGVFPGALTSAQLTALSTALIGTGRTTGTRTLDISVPERTLDVSVPSRTLDISVPQRTLEISA